MTNLFDYIKYQYIDLFDSNALETLPSELIKLYWHRAEFSRDAESEASITNNTRCIILASWMSNHEYDETEMLEMKAFYIASLKEYCNEPI